MTLCFAGLLAPALLAGAANSPAVQVHDFKSVAGPALRLHVYAPPEPLAAAARPAIVFFFGGSWVHGSPTQFMRHATYLASRGMVAVCPEYRTRESHGTTPFECVADGKDAVRWVRSHAKELGVDPMRIAASGGSAGGYVAAATAVLSSMDEPEAGNPVSCVPNALVLFNPVVDTTATGFGAKKFGARSREASPAHNIRAGLPPTIIFHGRADKTVPFENVQRFTDEMKKAGNACTLRGYDGQPHGFYLKQQTFYPVVLQEVDNFFVSLGWLAASAASGAETPRPSSQPVALVQRDALHAGHRAPIFNEYAPSLDLSSATNRQVVIAAGSPETYQGHATTALLADGKTLFAVWTTGHGGGCGPAAMSPDGGTTWQRVDDRFPAEYRTWKNCPSIFRMTDPQGKERLFVFACGTPDTANSRALEMARVVSEDNGVTWRVMPSLPLSCVMPMCSVIRLKDGAYLGQYNDRWPERKKQWNRVFQAVSRDGGLSWSAPSLVAQDSAMNLCEPFLLRSPDGSELCSILRDNAKSALSKLVFSRDEGKTWTAPEESSWGLTGHRHHGVQLKDGRWVIAFRDTAPMSPTSGHFVAWVGTYGEIKSRQPGKRIKLLHSYAGRDCGYAALTLLPDETILAVTYIKYWNDARKHSVVGVFIKPDDLEN